MMNYDTDDLAALRERELDEDRDAGEYMDPAYNDALGLVAEAEAEQNAHFGTVERLRGDIRQLQAELADTRHSEARYRDDRDEAVRMRHHAIEARFAALKRAKRAEAERDAARRYAGALRGAISGRPSPSGYHLVPQWAVNAFDAATGYSDADVAPEPTQTDLDRLAREMMTPGLPPVGGAA